MKINFKLNKINKYITSVICFFMCFSFTSSTAVAFYDINASVESDLQALFATKIMQGDDYGRFRPNDNLTKAEAITIILRMKGYANSYTANYSTFTDVPKSHWASQYIGLAQEQGIAKGDEYFRFGPNQNINSAEFLTLCLRLIGVGDVLDSTGRWPSAHVEFALDEEIIPELTKSIYEPITRMEAAQFANCFLSANMWSKSYKTGEFEKKEETIMSEYLSVGYYEDVLVDNVDNSRRTIDIIIKNTKGDYTESVENLTLPNTYDMDDLVTGMIANVWQKNGNILKIDIAEIDEELKIDFISVLGFDYESEYLRVKVDDRIKEFDLAKERIRAEINGETRDTGRDSYSSVKRFIDRCIDADVDDDDEEESYTGVLILNEDDEIISIKMYKYEYFLIVDRISNDKIYNNDEINYEPDLDLDDVDYRITNIDGEEVDIDDIDEGDMILYNKEDEPYSLLVLDNTIRGRVDQISEDESKISIDGDEYYINKDLCDDLPSKSDIEDKIRITFFLDQNSRVVAFNK